MWTPRASDRQVIRAGQQEQELAALQYSPQKSGYIAAVSSAVVDDRLNFDAIRALSPEQAISHLMKFRGVGRWTAEYVLMRGLGHPDCIPKADSFEGQAVLVRKNLTSTKAPVMASHIVPQ